MVLYGPLVKRLRQRPLTPLTSVRFRYGSPYAPLAQLVEQLTLNQWAQGSSPWRCTRYKDRRCVEKCVCGLFVYLAILEMKPAALPISNRNIPLQRAWTSSGLFLRFRAGQGRAPARRPRSTVFHCPACSRLACMPFPLDFGQGRW